MDEVKTEELGAVQSEEMTVGKVTTEMVSESFTWMDIGLVRDVMKVAKGLASSQLVPKSYRGKPWDVAIAMEMAQRMNMPLLHVLGKLYIVDGKPSWAGEFCISAVNGCGKYTPLEFDWITDEQGKAIGCSAYATNRETGRRCQGAPITWATVEGFGWNKKANSMWNIPGQREQQFMYRAASYFARAFCPEVLSGLYTVEEQKDISQDYTDVYDEEKKETVRITLDK